MRRPLPTILRYAALLALVLAPVAARAQVPGAGSAEAEPDASTSVWRGSNLSYSHNTSAVSLYKQADHTWNPYYAQRLTLHPEYHPNAQFYVWGQLMIDQELTNQDDATKLHDYFLSDTLVEGVWAGWKEPKSGIKLGGSLRAVIPTSAASRAATLRVALAPTVRATRNFDVLGGLSVGYYARVTKFFFGATTGEYAGTGIADCEDGQYCTTGRYMPLFNPSWGITHGPSVNLGVNSKLSFSLVTGIGYSHTYKHTAAVVHLDTGDVDLGRGNGIISRYSTLVSLAGNYQFNPLVGLSLGAYTYGPQLAPDSTYRDPFANRLTALFLEASLDAERLYALVAKHQ